jgi:hypothetical protein
MTPRSTQFFPGGEGIQAGSGVPPARGPGVRPGPLPCSARESYVPVTYELGKKALDVCLRRLCRPVGYADLCVSGLVRGVRGREVAA